MATYLDKISPPGYHVLTLSEIGLIQTALGVDAGGKMKTEGFEHWDDPNTGATNETGFSAVGCGKRDWNTGLFSGQRKQAMLWAADEYDTDNAGAYTMANGNALLGVAEQWNKGEGLSVRLAMDNPALFTPGMTVNDADGNTYNLVKIHLADAGLLVNYGLQYNWFAATDVRQICADGFQIPTLSIWNTMLTYLGGGSSAGQKLKESGITHWLTPNSGTNESKFYAVGAGSRNCYDGTFTALQTTGFIWLLDDSAGRAYNTYMQYNADSVSSQLDPKQFGFSIRPMRLATEAELLLPDGLISTKYIGFDLKEYPLTKIGNQIWLACNLAETQFSNGDYIHGYEGGVYTTISNSNWAALSTSGACFYNDIPSNGWSGIPAIDIVVTVENLRTTKYANGDPIVLAQPNNEWINAVGGAYCTFDPAPPQHVLNVTSTPFKVKTKLSGGVLPLLGTAFRKALHMVATTKELTTSLKTVEFRKGKGIAAEMTPFVTSLKTVNFVKVLTLLIQSEAYDLSLKNANLVHTTTADAIYIDPLSATNGIGTIGDPKNTLIGLTLQNYYTYLFKAGTTYTTATVLDLSNYSGVTITSYGVGDMPKFSFTGSGTCAIRFANSTNCSVIGLDVYTDITKSLIAIFQLGVGTGTNGGNGNTIAGCKIHNVKQGGVAGGMAIRGGGNNLSIVYNEIYDTGDDGMWLSGTVNLEVGYNNIHHVNQNYNGLSKGFLNLWMGASGDSIQLGGTWNGYHIHHNILDRTDIYTGNKYCLITNRTLGTPVTDGGIIEYNTFRANSNVLGQVILAFNLNTVIRYNTFEGTLANSNYVEGALKLASNTCINTLIYGNLFYDLRGKAISLSALSNLGSVGTKIFNNVFYNLQTGTTVTNTGAIWNNQTDVEVSNNIFHMAGNTGVALYNYSGTPVWTVKNNCFDSLASVGTSGQGSNAVIDDPMFEDADNRDFHLKVGSPCIETGLDVGLTIDYDGVTIPQGSAPCIGAFEFI